MKNNSFADKLVSLIKNSSSGKSSRSLEELIELVDKARKNSFPIYSLLIATSTDEGSNVDEKQLKSEGWITIEKEIPEQLKRKIISAVSLGILSAKDKDTLFNEARDAKVNPKRLELYINRELEIASKRINKQTSQKNRKIIIVSLSLFIIIFSTFSYYQFYLPYMKDKNAMRKYVVANNYNLRSTMSSASRANIIDEIPYGTEIIVYSMDEDWAIVKANGKEGYMGKPYMYLIDKKDFYEIDGLFGNKEARELLKSSKDKKAVRNYLINNSFSSKIPDKIQKELYGKINNSDVWQFFALTKDANYNTIAHGKYLGTNSGCLAIVITKISNENKRLLIFSFNEDEIDSLIYEAPYNKKFNGFQTAWKNKWRFQGEFKKGKKKNTKLKLDAIEFGINDEFKNYNKELLIYTGDAGFQEYTQPDK